MSNAAQVQESPRKWEMRRVWEGSAQLLDALDDGWEPFARHYVKDGRIHGHMIYLRRPMRDAANVPSYPMTPVDCLLSDLTAIAEQSYDEAMYEDFIERLRQWRLEKEQFDA